MEFIKLNIQFFGATNEATSSSSSSSGNKSTLYCKFTEADPTEAEKLSNKTKITAYCTYKQGGSFAAYYTPKLKLTWYDDKDNVNGKELGTLSVTSMSSGATKKIEPAAFYVTHKEDGSLNGYLKAEWIWTGGGHACPSTTATTTTTKLTTIPRANTFKSVPDSANVGQGFTVTLDKKISSSSTKVVCTCNGKSQEVTTSSDIATFSLPGATFAGAFGSTESKKTATITATTYNGTTQIGNSVTDTITLYLPQEAYKPVLSISAVDSNTNTKTLTGDTTGKTCVLNASTIVCTVSASAQNSATLSSVTINGKNVATTTTSYTISNPTTNVFTITASDSRGFPNTATDTLTKVVDYFKPTITANFKRNTPTDGKVKLTYSGKIFNKSFGAKYNELSFYYEYKLKSASSYTRVALSPEISGDTFSGDLTLDETYDYKQNYSFRLCVKDSLNTIVYAQDVAKGEPVFWWNDNGVYANGIVKGKMQSTESGCVGTSVALSSYWYKIWDAYITHRQYNDFTCTLQVNNRYGNQWGTFGFGIRQNGANGSGAYNLNANVRNISSNIPWQDVRLYYNNTTGYCALYVYQYGQYGCFPYKIVGKNDRTGTETASIPGTFYSGNYTEPQTLPSSSYVSMVDSVLAKVYPVGSVFMSLTDGRNPVEIVGFGTWVQIQGLTLVGAGTYTDSNNYSYTFTAGTVAGAYTHTHVMTNHIHARGTLTAPIAIDNSYIYSRWDTTANKNGTQTATWTRNARKPISGTNSANSASMTEGAPVIGNTGAMLTTAGASSTIYTGGGSSVQPSLPIYMWKRTA